ncbi:MAG: LysM peptidoglycan-binding domain-containing protein [Deltaproteobacteria bacterium]|nr:LysM peptidoglycan-binding domain-containing protein [Deltaproteobacteria bacterium]
MNILAVIVLLCILSACAKQPSKTALVEKPPEVKQETLEEKKAVPEKPSVVAEKPAPEAAVIAEADKKEAAETKVEAKEPVKKKLIGKDQHTVKKGESLWWIAKYKDRYNDPYLWPLIYETNKKKIKNPDLIYPGQKFDIPRKGYSMEVIKQKRKKAGAPKPYLPPKEAFTPLD